MTEIVYAPAPAEVLGCDMAQFTRFAETRAGRLFASYGELHRFSVEEPARFWPLLLEWLDLAVEGTPERALVGDDGEHSVFFPDLRLNYVVNLLRERDAGDGQRLALVCWSEGRPTERVTREQLQARVLHLACDLRSKGVQPGTRVAAVARNTGDAVVACLACAALGAVWCSAGTDLGHEALLARLGQFKPEVLFHHAHHRLGGESASIEQRIRGLVADLPGLRMVIGLDDERVSFDLPRLAQPAFARPGSGGSTTEHFDLGSLPLLPFNHPLFVLFTSGTTGAPKGILHGAGGTLLEHHKEHRLHTGLVPGDLLYFQTTCGWMMWNWMLSALACRAAIGLYDGVVVHPRPGAQLEVLGRDGVTVFGTSPSFLQALRDSGDLSEGVPSLPDLRLILSTGAVLPAALFAWVRDRIKPVSVQSISGGTDIIGCFLLGNPMLPVHAGELQCRSLGYDVDAVAVDGHAAGDSDVAVSGELVCRGAFPSRPLGLLDDPDGTRFHATYFSRNPGMWTHGDLVEFTVRGGARVLGRADGVLNVGGIRIGPAEIRRALESVPEVRECVAVEQRSRLVVGASRFVLVVVLRQGVEFDRELAARIRRQLRERCSSAHVPAVIVPVSELPVTHNGKLSERAVRDAVNGHPIGNLEALRNPRSIDELRARPELSEIVAAPRATTPDGLQGSDVLGRVIAVWQEVLSTPVHPDDAFFEIGGDSLRGLHVLNGIEREFEMRLPMSCLLFSGSTPRGMADLVRAVIAGDSRSTVVPLCRGGSGRPVFLIPGGGLMSVLAFRDLSRRIGDRPFFGLEARLDGAPSPSLRDLAKEFVDAVLTIDPQGPHLLFGFSSGAFVAYEMAAQLVAMGRPPALVVVFDAHLPVRHSGSQKVRVALQRAMYHGKGIASIPARRWLSYLASVGHIVRKRVYERFFPERAIGWRHELGSAGAPASETAFDRRDRHNRGLIASYRASPLPQLDVRLAVVLAERTSWSGVEPALDPRLAWKACGSGELEVLRVAGSHLSMLEPPEVDGLAGALVDLFERAQPQPPSGHPDDWRTS